jgi:hypothetical protein
MSGGQRASANTVSAVEKTVETEKPQWQAHMRMPRGGAPSQWQVRLYIIDNKHVKWKRWGDQKRAKAFAAPATHRHICTALGHRSNRITAILSVFIPALC